MAQQGVHGRSPGSGFTYDDIAAAIDLGVVQCGLGPQDDEVWLARVCRCCGLRHFDHHRADGLQRKARHRTIHGISALVQGSVEGADQDCCGLVPVVVARRRVAGSGVRRKLLPLNSCVAADCSFGDRIRPGEEGRDDDHDQGDGEYDGDVLHNVLSCEPTMPPETDWRRRHRLPWQPRSPRGGVSTRGPRAAPGRTPPCWSRP